MNRILRLQKRSGAQFIVVLSLVVCFAKTGVAQSESSNVSPDSGITKRNLTAKQWQEDLRFLQKTLHKDYSGILSKKTTPAKFDAAVEKFNNEIPKLQEHEIVVGFARMLAMLEYGHTQMILSSAPVKFNRLPIVMYEFSDGVHIQGVHKDYADVLGSKVIAIEGTPIEKALELVRPVVSTENDQFLKASGYVYLCFPEVLHAVGITKELKQEIEITFLKDQKQLTQKIKSIPRQPMPFKFGFLQTSRDWMSVREESDNPLYLKHPDKRYYFEYLEDHKTVYVRQSTVLDDPNESIAEFYDRVFKYVNENDVEKLVLDFRLNGGGNNYKNKPIVTGLIESKKINQKGKLFAIIGRQTFSACQNLVNELDNYTNVTFVGEPTAENINFYGDSSAVILPHSKLEGRVSFAWWQDKPQWENGPWTEPDIAVEMSFEDYRTNKDPVVDAILKVNNDDSVFDPIGYIQKLVEQKEIDETAVRDFIKDPRLEYWAFEDAINQSGYKLMNAGNVKQAIVIFQLNHKLNPESANAWDSLGEGFLKNNQKEKAIECYEKAISLDPEGPIGANAKAMLEQIKSGSGS